MLSTLCNAPLYAPVATSTLPPPDDLLGAAQLLVESIRNGNVILAIAVAVVVVVTVLRKFGPSARRFADAGSAFGTVLAFFLDSKPGGWILNAVASSGGVIAAAALAGQPVGWATGGIVLAAVGGAAGLWEFISDLIAWRKGGVIGEIPGPVGGPPTPGSVINRP